MEQVNDISALMKKLHLKDWRDLERQEAKATFSEVRISKPYIVFPFPGRKNF